MGGLPWSATRVRSFRDCRRKFYYRYLLAPQGRRPDAPAEAVEAARMKDLTGLEAWAGNVVHQVVQDVLARWRAGREFPQSQAVAHAVRLLSRQYRDSGRYWSAHPDEFTRRPPLLDLHFYSEGALARERAQTIKERVVTAVCNFLQSDLAARCRAVGPANWLPIDRNAAARLSDDLTILVKPDFAFRDGERLWILDWKTGQPDPFWEMIQVTCYALYAAEKWNCPLPRVVPKIVHLYPSFFIAETEYSEQSIRDVKLFIRETHEEIQSAISASDSPEALLPADRFHYTEDCSRCRWCQFRGLCDGARREA